MCTGQWRRGWSMIRKYRRGAGYGTERGAEGSQVLGGRRRPRRRHHHDGRLPYHLRPRRPRRLRHRCHLGELGALRRPHGRTLFVPRRRLARHKPGQDEPHGVEALREAPGEGVEDSRVRDDPDRRLLDPPDGRRGFRDTALDRGLYHPRLPFSEATIHQPHARHPHFRRRPVCAGTGSHLRELLAVTLRRRARRRDDAGLQAALALVRRRPDRVVLRERDLRRWPEALEPSEQGAACCQTALAAGEKLAVHIPYPPAYRDRVARPNRHHKRQLLVELQSFFFVLQPLELSGPFRREWGGGPGESTFA